MGRTRDPAQLRQRPKPERLFRFSPNLQHFGGRFVFRVSDPFVPPTSSLPPMYFYHPSHVMMNVARDEGI